MEKQFYEKRFCNRCGKLLNIGEKCTCKLDVKLVNKDNSYHNTFYDSLSWRKLREAVKQRDYNQDRLQLYFVKKGRPEAGVIQQLYDFCIDAYGTPRRFNGRLLVHHIVPREDNYNLQYEKDNLISLNYYVHEYVHELYRNNKTVIQNLLHSAVAETLP